MQIMKRLDLHLLYREFTDIYSSETSDSNNPDSRVKTSVKHSYGNLPFALINVLI